jgi:hypothetical protein
MHNKRDSAIIVQPCLQHYGYGITQRYAQLLQVTQVRSVVQC